jgi:class 3 adenylate cyclase
MPKATRFSPWRRISTLLLTVLTAIGALILLGLVVVTARLTDMREDLGQLSVDALPRLVKLSQLSQEASSAIALAPALSAKPTRFEFETLKSRILDKEKSQAALIDEIVPLIRKTKSAEVLQKNVDLLRSNLDRMTKEVSRQIDLREKLGSHLEKLEKALRSLDRAVAERGQSGAADGETEQRMAQTAAVVVHRIVATLLDPNDARLSRNRRGIEQSVDALTRFLAGPGAAPGVGGETPAGLARELLAYWNKESEDIFSGKTEELANEFRIKALAEENALIANRLLASANNEFRRANKDLQSQILLVENTTRFTIVTIIVVVAGFGIGNLVVWLVLRQRVFGRLQRIRDALQSFAEERGTVSVDPLPDEIGEISQSMAHYMNVIDEREAELAGKNQEMETLSNQLAKYLSPQVYDSIFRSKQEVKVASSRKKLTVFFSDIAGFTETADRLESEELTSLLNHYLTEMSQIALRYGATIDKYVGDAILIFFGDPESKGIREDALACVKMAIDMRERLRDLREVWRESGIEHPLHCRMGIHTDYCTVGNFGSETRLDYTIIGRGVNLASRLETSAQADEILISYETYAHVSGEIQCEERGHIDVKGIAHPVAVYSVVGSRKSSKSMELSISSETPHLKLEADPASMSPEERRRALDVLREAVRQLAANVDTRRQDR